MATNMFVTGIPNGTSLDIQRGTALYLVKSLVKSARTAEDGSYGYDLMRIGQLAGCLGISKDEAEEVCNRVIGGEVEEELIGRYAADSHSLKEKTSEAISGKLKELHSKAES